MSETLEDKRAEMQSAASSENYEAAIVARDACHQLELQQRSLQLSLDSHQRSTVLHSLGAPFISWDCNELLRIQPHCDKQQQCAPLVLFRLMLLQAL